MEVTGRQVTLPCLANYLSARVNRVVVDRTGLSGGFDFNAELAVDQTEVYGTLTNPRSGARAC